jgi:hypothetical protein
VPPVQKIVQLAELDFGKIFGIAAGQIKRVYFKVNSF